MKNILKSILPILLIISVSCEDLVDGDGDININPNNPTSTGYQSVLTTAGVGQVLLQNGITSRLAGIFAGTHTGIDRQYGGYNQYSITTSDFNGLWDDLFINAFRNARLSRQLAEEQGITGITTGVCQVLEALSLGTGAALYGDIPFDELAQIEIDNPRFENQTEVYAKIQLLLDDAIANLNSGTGRPAAGSDIFFDGSPAQWIEVANTLKARYYLHTGEYALAYAAAQNGISDVANSMYAPYGSAIEASNLNWQLFELESQGDDIEVSAFFRDMLDPAVATNRSNAKTNEAARFAYLIDGNILNTSANGFADQEAPGPIVTYQENMLILAEAGYRSVDFATGLAELNGFRAFMSAGGYLVSPDAASVQYDAYAAADFDNGGIENQDGTAAGDALLREILEERYITLFSQTEVFNDVVRTADEAVARVPVVPNTGSDLPKRFLYAQSEIDRNTNTPNPVPGLFELTPVNQ